MSDKTEADRLADWLDSEACGGHNWNAKMHAAAAELRRLSAVERELRAEVARLGADAGRYRWLRHGDNDDHVIRRMSDDGEPFLLRNERLDACIDEAMRRDEELWGHTIAVRAAMKGGE